jgi:hypothetical protein
VVPAALLAAVASPVPLAAHVRWFTDAGPFANAEFLLDVTTLLVVVGAVLYAGLAIFVRRSGKFDTVTARLKRVAESVRDTDWRLIAVLSGIMLIGNAMMGFYLAPNIELPFESLTSIGAGAQVVVGLLLLFQVSFLISGALVLLVAVLTLAVVSPAIMVDYVFEFVALGGMLVLIGPSCCRIDRRLADRWGLDKERMANLAVPVIRVGVGLTLVTLALHNKLGNPGLTMAFLEEYPLNFMALLGFEGFTNLHFTFAAGVGELTLGILITLGISTRFVVATLTVFFIITVIVLGPIELLGHAPLVGIAVMLILRGSGEWTTGRVPEPALTPA